MRKKKKKHKSPHLEKNDNNSKREQQQQQRQEPGGFFLVLQTKHLDHTIEMVNKEKICIKKTFSTITTSMLHQNVCLSGIFFFFFDILHHFAIQLLAPYPPLSHYPPRNIPVTLSSPQGTFT